MHCIVYSVLGKHNLGQFTELDNLDEEIYSTSYQSVVHYFNAWQYSTAIAVGYWQVVK